MKVIFLGYKKTLTIGFPQIGTTVKKKKKKKKKKKEKKRDFLFLSTLKQNSPYLLNDLVCVCVCVYIYTHTHTHTHTQWKLWGNLNKC